MENNEEFYTSQEIADKLKINVMTVYRHINSGKLKAIKTGKDFRVLKSDFEDYLENNQQKNVLEEKDNKILLLEKKIAKLQNNIKKQRYGLVWVDVPEAFEDDVENKLPILKEDPKLAIESKDEKPTHILIEGDNYHALTCLNYTHKEKIDVIYIDPPYNTGSDGFKYKDKRILNEFPDGTLVPKDNPYRHSYWLSFMSKRLELAKALLKEDGTIFISIDDNEYPRLIMLMEEIFPENKIKTICVKMSEPTGVKMAHIIRNGGIPKLKEYLVLAKMNGIRDIHIDKIPKINWDDEYKTIILNISPEEIAYLKDVRANEDRTQEDIIKCDSILSKFKAQSISNYLKEQKIINKLDTDSFKINNAWRIIQVVSMSGGAKVLADKKRNETTSKFFSITTPQNKMYFIKNDYDPEKEIPRIKVLFADDYLTTHPGDFWQDIKTTGLDNEGGVDFKNGKKPLALIRRVVSSIKKKDAVVLDFFAGSGTLGEAVLELNKKDEGRRQFILVTNNEDNIMTNVCRSRIVNSLKNLGGSVKHYKTAFVGRNNILNSTDQDRSELAHNAGELLAIAENTLYEQKKNEFYQIFKDKNRYTDIYFREEMDKFDEFIQEVQKLIADEISVYIFSWESDETIYEFEDMKNIRIKTIPQPIVEIYKQIYNLV